MTTGIDISYSQSLNFDAAAARSEIEFCILKAGGSNAGRYTDSKYRAFEPRFRSAGYLIGHYWFNGEGDPREDAEFFVKNLSGYSEADLLVLDIENEGSMPAWNAAQAMVFCRRVKELTGKVPMLYMSSSVAKSSQWAPLVALGCKLWVAQYGSNNGQPGSRPGSLGPWGDDWLIWQYTSTGRVNGYNGDLDKNTTPLTVAQLSASQGGASTPAAKRSAVVTRRRR